MRSALRLPTSRIRSKIIVPYLLLAVCLATAMTFVAIRLTVGTLQERIDTRLIEAGQAASDGLVALEAEQLSQLRPLVFTQGMAEAVAARDGQTLATLLRPHWTNAQLASVIVFDQNGHELLGWQRAANAAPADDPQPATHDLTTWWLVRNIVRGQTDAYGDKWTAFRDTFLYTAAPVRLDDQVVGGIIIGLPTQHVLDRLQSRSQASVITLYDRSGQPFASTQITTSASQIAAMPSDLVAQLSRDPAQHVQRVAALNGREHQVAYSPLQVRRAMDGFFAVGVSRQFMIDTWAGARNPLIIVALLFVLAVVGVGLALARHITRPLHDLVGTAHAVAAGELERRSTISSGDEFGLLARSFNQMTERLLHLYATSRNLSQHAQIDQILAQTHTAIQPLVPDAQVLALLEDHDGWRMYGADQIGSGIAIDAAVIHTLQAHAQQSAVIALDQVRAALALSDQFNAAWCNDLVVQNHTFGVLLVLHAHADAFGAAVRAPLAAVVSMATTALGNSRLYAQIQTEAHRRRVILESIADGVIVCDAQRNVVLMNAAAETLLHVHDWAEHRRHFEHLPLTPITAASPLLGSTHEDQLRFEAHGRVLSASCADVTTDHGRWGEVIVLHNISDEVALDSAKTNLIGMISHELRTPLTGIQGTVDLLAKGIGGQLSSLQQELADAAARQSRAMSSLIDQAILVANIESGALAVELRPTGLRDLIQTTLATLAEPCAAVDLELRIADDVPDALVDPHLLKLALRQVIDNAIKYGAGTPVTIAAHADSTQISLSVRDNGPGIAADDLPHLFRRLHRNADSSNAASRGLGLGLVIARELIERQHGSISVHSSPGQGSTFTFVLPRAHDAVQAAA